MTTSMPLWALAIVTTLMVILGPLSLLYHLGEASRHRALAPELLTRAAGHTTMSLGLGAIVFARPPAVFLGLIVAGWAAPHLMSALAWKRRCDKWIPTPRLRSQWVSEQIANSSPAEKGVR